RARRGPSPKAPRRAVLRGSCGFLGLRLRGKAPAFEVDEQQRDRRRSDALQPRGLAHGLRTDLRELLLDLLREPADAVVVDVARDPDVLLGELAGDLVLLALDVARVLGGDLH